ncbi:MAG: beta-galactosidase [Pirellulaceae bacterium]
MENSSFSRWVLASIMVLGSGGAQGQQPPPTTDAPIGWCCFYPYVDVGMDQLPDSAANTLSVCAGGWGMVPAEGTYDFSAFDRQLAFAQRHGLKLALIQEINPVYAPAWLRAKAKASGQAVVNAAGVAGEQPTLTSTVFREAQEELVRKFVAHVQQADTTGTVAYYHPGAEWWFPLHERYNPAEIERFRQWLADRYQTVERLNAAWESRYATFADAPAPPVEMMLSGREKTGLGPLMALDDGSQHCSWSTPAATDPQASPGPDTYCAAEPGKPYTVSAWVKTEDVRGYGAFVEIAWVRATGGPPVLIDTSMSLRGTHDWTQISATFSAPREAGRAWILLKLMGSGRVTWDDIEFRETSSAENMAPNPGLEAGGEQPAAWRLQNWSGEKQLDAHWTREGGRTGNSSLQVHVPLDGSAAGGHRNIDAAVHDWSLFWNETAADYINRMSQLVKSCDPTRKTVTYLTFSFAYPAEWDYTQYYAIAPDEVAMRGHDIDAFGMQICSADGDPYRVTACLDLVRKYGKPMWAVDLVDFTSGVQIGYPVMDRVTQSAIQHGARGIIYCAWHIPSVLDYSYHPRMAPAEIRQMLTDARATAALMQGLTVRPRAALLQPILPASPNDMEGFKNDFRSFIGWYKLLEGVQETFDVVTLQEIAPGAVPLDRYRYIVVPDCAYLPEDVVRRLDQYVQSGGKLMTAGRFAERNETGRLLSASLPSVPRTTVPDHGKLYTGDPLRDTHAGNTPPLFLWRADTPTTEAARRDGITALRAFQTAIDVRPAFTLQPEEASLGSVEYDGPGERALFLVNWGAEPVPADQWTLTLEDGATTYEVYADTQRVEPNVSDRTLTLPAFRTSCIIKLRDSSNGLDTPK